ncbi:hypothetical protein [Rhodococcus qingshengii]|uniref:hypothetical protein n=1 Tax=Rhodococcus qingshengii TaxID=334542 RepID=UPI00237CBCBE|nr:hypothetical protein [Rhodococcus qingshengii]WCT06015.1 hypothetical protein PI247_29805 [Rhodococcus qingshengii]
MNWIGYEPYTPIGSGPSASLNRETALLRYNDCIHSKSERIDQLYSLVHANGETIDMSDEGVNTFESWFRKECERDPLDETRPSLNWISVTIDSATFLGELLIERNPHLFWKFNIADNYNSEVVSYQSAVIAGFKNGIPSGAEWIDSEFEYIFDPDDRVGRFSFSLAKRGTDTWPNFFAKQIAVASKRA